MSNGTLQQLSSRGVQDGHLSIAPETSFFKRTYKRVSNYAIEAVDQGIPALSWGKSFTAEVSRNGDLTTECWFTCNIKLLRLNDDASGADTVRWTNVLGHAMFTSIKMEIGNNEIDTISDLYMEIIHETQSDVNINVDELVLRSESEAQLVEWANNGNTLDTLSNAVVQIWTKFPFWFSKARSQALPVIALQYHDIRVKFNLRPKTSLMVFSNASNKDLSTTFDGEINFGCLVFNYAFLDSQERRLFASSSHEYLIKNIQTSDFHTKGLGEDRVSARVTFNHPVTALYWVVQRDDYVSSDGNPVYDYFNFERTKGLGDDTFTSAVIKFNGSEREKARGPLYYRVIQASLYWPRTPRKNIYMFSFAQYPTAWFPSGSCNMSRIDNTTMTFTFPKTDANGASYPIANVSIIADAFNVIRLQGGMMAKKYAN